MRNVLSLYLDTSSGSTEELNRLICKIEMTIEDQFTEREKEVIAGIDPVFSKRREFVTLPILEEATGYSVENLSRIRNGKKDVPYHLIRHVRVIAHRVEEDPELAYAAVSDWIERKIGDEREEKALRES